ncbi:MAG TPA: hypothetical protein VHQ90_15285 [Thermoanaerobaculia bacterium]|nr:hypothetical protein [Thermoanaerobaculia bacterium]
MSPRRALAVVVTVALASVLALGVAEAVLRLLERRGRGAAARRTRYEEAYAAKAFRKDGIGDAGFLAENFRGYVTNEYGRPVEWVNNSSGFRSRRDFAPRPPTGTLRILALGDSFLVGHRVGQDDTFCFLLEGWLRARRGRDVEVLIAAVEHPVTGLYYLQIRGLRFAPHMVLVGISIGDDIAQVYFNLGPLGRYRLLGGAANGVIEPNPAADHDAQVAALRALRLPAGCLGPREKAWAGSTPPGAAAANGEQAGNGAAGSGSPDRASNHPPSLRLAALVHAWLADRRARNAPQAATSTWGAYREPALFDGNALGIYLKEPPPPIAEAYRRLERVLRGYRRLCARQRIRLAVVILPQRAQVQPPDWQATVRAYSLRPDCFDPLTPNRAILGICRRLGLTCLDPTPALAELYHASGESLYMPLGDAHWTTRGHRAVFEAIRAGVARAAAGLPDAGAGTSVR